MTEVALYRCENEGCHLGSRSEPGHFTGGISELQALMLTGDPDAPNGEGICPNCGTLATELEGGHQSVEGEDPNEKAHRSIALDVAEGKLKPEKSQAALEEMVKGGDDA